MVTTKTIKYAWHCTLMLIGVFYSINSFAQVERELYENYRLNLPLPSGRNVESYQLSPDGQRVVFLADADFEDQFELYSVSIKGGVVTKLNQRLLLDSDVSRFLISPDGQWVVYQIIAANGIGSLYSIAIDGSGSRLLESGSQFFSDAHGKFILNNKNTLVFESFSDPSGATLIHSIFRTNGISMGQIAGGSYPLSNGFSSIRFSSNDETIVYLYDPDVATKFELYAAQLTPTTSGQHQNVSNGIKINAPINDNGDVNSNYIISPDGSRVIYSANRFGGAGDNLLYSADTTGLTNAITLLNISQAPQKLGGFKLTPNGQTVIFEARLSTDVNEEVYNYYSIPVAGGTRTSLTERPVGEAIRDFTFDISADSKYLVLANNRFGPDDNPNGHLYSIDIDAGFSSTLKLNDLPSAGSSYPPNATITPDGKTVIYSTATGTAQSIYALPVSPFVPNNGVLLHSNPFTESEVVAVSPNSEQVIYRQRLLGGGIFNRYPSIFVNDTKGGNAHQINVNPINTTVSIIDSLEITKNSEFAVYLGQEVSGAAQELFAVRISEADDELCMPIKASNGKIAVICL